MVGSAPANISVDIKVVGDERIARTMMSWAYRAEHPQPVLATMAEYRMEENKRQFDSEGEYGGHKWDEIKDDTRERKIANSQDDRILHATLRLRESLTEVTDDTILEIDSRGFALGTSVPYAAVHQDGSEDHNIPRREIFVERPDTGVIMTEMLKSWIVGRSILKHARRGGM